MNLTTIKSKILHLDKEKKVRFIFLYGSVAEQRNTPISDVDIAIYYEGSTQERFSFRQMVLGHFPETIDAQVFQDLPLPVQKEVIQGKVLYQDDEEFLISTCIEVVRHFEAFEKYYEMYLDAVRQEVAV